MGPWRDQCGMAVRSAPAGWALALEDISALIADRWNAAPGAGAPAMTTAHPAPIVPPAASPTPGVHAIVLLGGGVLASTLARMAGRSILDLQITHGESILDLWSQAIQREGFTSPPEVRVLHSAAYPAPILTSEALAASRLAVFRDRGDFRGPAGALRDACEADPEDAAILVADGASFLRGRLTDLLEAHARSSASVTMAVTTTGATAGAAVLRAGALRLVRAQGFMDFKEQFLNAITGAGEHVSTHVVDPDWIAPIRDRATLLRAAEIAADRLDRPLVNVFPGGRKLVLGTGTSGSLVCAGARVAGDAVVAGSVVMAGATVGAGSIVARSVVLPDAVIPPGAEALDQLVGTAGPVDDQAAVALARQKELSLKGFADRSQR